MEEKRSNSMPLRAAVLSFTVLLSLLVLSSGIIAGGGIKKAQGAEDALVVATASSYQETNILEYTNTDGNIFGISSIVLQINGDSDFQSFKTEKGWLGKRTGPDTIKFTAAEPLPPGNSIKFGIKTTTPEPEFSWRALDEEGDQIGDGQDLAIGEQQQQEKQKQEKDSQEKDNTEPEGSEKSAAENNNAKSGDSQKQQQPKDNQSQKPNQQQPPKDKPGILSESRFRLIPDEPRVGSTLRVSGERFGPNENLEFYIDDQKMNSVVTNEAGRFVFTTKIPQDMEAKRVDFVIKDDKDNEKSMSLRIKERPESRSTQIVTEEQPLTVEPIGEVHHGENKVIKGTATPGRTLTVILFDPSGDETEDQLTSMTTEVNNDGAYKVSHKVPVDRTPGQYRIEVSDGKDTKEITYNVVSQGFIKFDSPRVFDAGSEIEVEVTGPPNEEVEFSVIGPGSKEKLFEIIKLDESGKTTIKLPLDASVMEGTYTIKAVHENRIQTYFVGVGQEPKAKLTVNMDKTNYDRRDTATMSITAPPDSKVNLVVVDSAGKEKFSDTIDINPYGVAEYDLDLSQYSTGVYSAVLTRGNSDTEKRFTVGLEVGSGPIEFRTIKDKYFAGEKVLILGDTKPDVIINVELLDTEGKKVRSTQTFADRKGVFSAKDLSIPTDAQPGEWTIEAFSGVNHVTKKIEVLEAKKDELSVELDKDPAEYDNDENVFISGTAPGRTSKTVVITITDEQGEQVDKLTIFSTKGGAYNTQWDIPDELSSGEYTLTVDVQGEEVETSFRVN